MSQLENKKQWYVVNTYAGHENRVKENLEKRLETMGISDNLFRVVVAEETQIEVKNEKSKEVVRNIFPGYLFVEMIMTDEAWYVVRNTPGVTGFLGSSGKGAKPFPLFDHEIDKILQSMGMSRKEISVDLKVDDRVKITDGPFKLMAGKITEIDLETGKAKVSIDLFGQETIVEVDLVQLELDQ